MAASASDKICAAALKLAAQGWNNVTLAQIAKAANMPLPRLQAMFGDKNMILPVIVRMIDAETADGIGKPDIKAPPHDRLFEVMMARFDCLQAYRPAILGIMTAARRDPRMLRFLAPAQWQAMRHMLALAGLKPDGGRQVLAIAGLSAVYGAALCAWRRDESADMARTMAILDKGLRHAGRIGEMIFRLA